MNNTRKRHNPYPGLALAALLYLLFFGFTILVMRYDVDVAGPGGSTVGFSKINLTVNEMFPGDGTCLKASEYIGYLCIGIAGANALIALVDFIRARGFAKMHKRYLMTMILYATIAGFYLLFEYLKINMRPSGDEASYPSTHTLLAINVLYSEILLLTYSSNRSRAWADLLRMLFAALMISMVFMRLFSGVHWLSDIVGAVLLALAANTLYRVGVRYYDP